MIVDLHNHTILCNHAEGSIEAYVLKAIEEKIDIFSHMKTVFKAENNIRSKYYHLFKNFFHKKQTVLDNIGELTFPEKKIFAKETLPNIENYISGEYDGKPNGKDLQNGSITKFALLGQTDKTAVETDKRSVETDGSIIYTVFDACIMNVDCQNRV